MSDQGQPQDPAAPGGQPQGLPPAPGQYQQWPAPAPPAYPDPTAPAPYQPTEQLPQYGQYGQYGEQPQYPHGEQPQYGQQPQYPQYPEQPQYPGYAQPGWAGAGGTPPPPVPPAPPGPPSGGSGRRGLIAGVGVIVAIVLAVLAYFLFSSGSSGATTPKDAVKNLLEAGKKLDAGKIKSSLCKADAAAPGIGGAAITGGDRITSYSIGATTQKGDKQASVTATISTRSEPQPQHIDFPVVKEGGAWKVCLTDLLGTLPGGTVTPPSAAPSDTPATEPPPSAEPSLSLPTSIPSGLLPSGLPTDIVPSTLPGGVNFCASSTDALTPAQAYIGAAEVGISSIAQACVYQDSVPKSVTDSLKGRFFAPSGGDRTGGGDKGPKGVYLFTSVGGDRATVTITTTRQSDGKYYVTDVRLG